MGHACITCYCGMPVERATETCLKHELLWHAFSITHCGMLVSRAMGHACSTNYCGMPVQQATVARSKGILKNEPMGYACSTSHCGMLTGMTTSY